MFDLKVIKSVLNQLEEERGVPRERALDAIEKALGTAYKKEYGKDDQIIRAEFDPESGDTEFYQVKIVVDESTAVMPDEERGEDDDRVRFNPEHHILLEDAKKIKNDVEVEDEVTFPLEDKEEYGRISAQTAKQVIIQKIREAEKESVYEEFEDKQGEVVSGSVQRIERGNVYIDLGRATGILPRDEQIPNERFQQGERVRAYLTAVDESSRGIFLRLSRTKPEFLHKLFAMEAPEIDNGVVEVKSIAREPGSRSKIAVTSDDEYVDPVGACVGQRGVRVNTVMSELGNEKIDIIEWSENPGHFVEQALSPADVLNVEIDEDAKRAVVTVSPDQQSLAIGKGGQNARLAAKLTGWKIDIRAAEDEEAAAESEEVFEEESPEIETIDESNTDATEDDAAQSDTVDESGEGDEAETENDAGDEKKADKAEVVETDDETDEPEDESAGADENTDDPEDDEVEGDEEEEEE